MKLRLITGETGSGPYNMAADEALFTELAQGNSPPALRFYQWNVPTLSLGYFQKTDEINLNLVREKGFQAVRRPTGGRAVLHREEVTFCLTMPTGGRGLWDIFKSIHMAIGSGLNMAGIPARVLPVEISPGSGKNRTAACFASPSRYELTLNGKKIAGSAQKRSGDFMLIHGSIPLKSSFKILFDLMVFPDEKSRRDSYMKALEKMTSLRDCMGKEYDFTEIARYITVGFEKEWGVEIFPGKYSSKEKELVERLEKNKYGNNEWLYKY